MEQPSMEQPSILERLRAFNRWTKGWAASIAVAVGIWIVLRSYLIEAFRIPSASMENTLLVGDFLFVNKAIYGGELEIPLTGIRCCRLPGYAEPQRDGIVVFRSVEDSTPNLNIVKRVIGGPTDTLQMTHDTVYRNGKRLDEPYALHLGSQPDDPAQLVTRGRGATLTALCTLWSVAAAAQQRDTTAPPHPADSLKVYTLPPAVVSVTRANPPINRIPQAVHLIERTEISRGRPTWGLDEALVTVPGVYAANRYNFSLDQRISIRGFGARSAFAVRGIKVLVDGIPQTLPDGQGQLTNLELGAADRIEILRGSASALFGNASGGVISIWTDPTAPRTVRQDVRVLFGTFDRDLNRNWSKWQSSTSFRVGSGSALVTVSRLDYTGQRQHSDADFRNLNSRWHFPLAPGWSLAATADVGWDPRADNPGALTNNEMRVNRDSAARLNITQVAGKDVTQGQGGATVRRDLPGGGEASLTVFGITRRLKNPTTFAYIDLKRFDYGARFCVSRPVPLGSLEQR